MENLKILRKLEIGEEMMNRFGFGMNTIRTLRLRTRIDLFAHLDRLKPAIHAWKSSQPILRAKVVRQDDDGLFYAIDENSSANRNLENVHFLRIRSRCDDNNTDLNKVLIDENLLIELVVEKCGSEVIDIDKPHDLMWQLVVIEMKQEAGEFVYEFIWHISHVITDGTSMSKNFVRLLDLIHRSIHSKPIDETIDFGVFRGTEALFGEEIQLSPGFPPDPPVLPRPAFLDPQAARLSSRSLYDPHFQARTHQQLDLELYEVESGKTYVSLVELIRIAKEVSNLKRVKFVVSGDKYKKFAQK